MLFYSESFINCYYILLYGDISQEVDEALYEVELIIEFANVLGDLIFPKPIQKFMETLELLFKFHKEIYKGYIKYK